MEASCQWAIRPADQRYETLGALRDAVHKRRMVSRSTDVDVRSIKAEESNGTIILNSAIAPCEPSHWAFGQFSSMIGAPSNYLRKLPTNLAVDCINNGIQNSAREEAKFMTVIQDDGTTTQRTLQAVTSPTYGRIWDADCVDAVQRIVERTGGRFYNPLAYDRFTGVAKPSGLYASDRDVFMFMIDGGSRLEVGPRAKLNRGFFVWNSETGSKTFGLMTFLFNEVCGNHIVWGAQQINKLVIRHSKNGPYRFDSDAAPMLAQYASASIKEDETTIQRAMARRLPKGDELFELLAPFKFQRNEIKEAFDTAVREEGQCDSLWDMVQGFTAFARGFDFIDARIDLEKRAGALLKLVAE